MIVRRRKGIEYPLYGPGDIIATQEDCLYFIGFKKEGLRQPLFLVNLDSGEILPFKKIIPHEVFPHAELYINQGFLLTGT